MGVQSAKCMFIPHPTWLPFAHGYTSRNARRRHISTDFSLTFAYLRDVGELSTEKADLKSLEGFGSAQVIRSSSQRWRSFFGPWIRFDLSQAVGVFAHDELWTKTAADNNKPEFLGTAVVQTWYTGILCCRKPVKAVCKSNVVKLTCAKSNGSISIGGN